jgi:hypothetical protein
VDGAVDSGACAVENEGAKLGAVLSAGEALPTGTVMLGPVGYCEGTGVAAVIAGAGFGGVAGGIIPAIAAGSLGSANPLLLGGWL